jgi:hypothetical protein
MKKTSSNDEFSELIDKIATKGMSFLQLVIFANIVVLIVAQIIKALT